MQLRIFCEICEFRDHKNRIAELGARSSHIDREHQRNGECKRQFALGGVDGIGTDGHEVRCELQEQRASHDEEDTDHSV
jgi:hypothetical protein